jgi:hypothetical protein
MVRAPSGVAAVMMSSSGDWGRFGFGEGERMSWRLDSEMCSPVMVSVKERSRAAFVVAVTRRSERVRRDFILGDLVVVLGLYGGVGIDTDAR